MKNKEIERKFLVDLKDVPSKYNIHMLNYGDIVQGYIASIDNSFSFRIRQTLIMSPDSTKIDEKYSQTIKDNGTKIRDEYEIELNKDQFSTLWKLCMYRSIHKFRYVLKNENGLNYELDVFKNGNSGLVTIEVEFNTIDECDSFIVPEWFGKEITEDKKYKNLYLALNKV